MTSNTASNSWSEQRRISDSAARQLPNDRRGKISKTDRSPDMVAASALNRSQRACGLRGNLVQQSDREELAGVALVSFDFESACYRLQWACRAGEENRAQQSSLAAALPPPERDQRNHGQPSSRPD